MGILRKIFGKKKIELPSIEKLEDLPEVENDLICTQCNMTIHPGQKIKTFAGKKMHMKPCWYKMQKIAKACI